MTIVDNTGQTLARARALTSSAQAGWDAAAFDPAALGVSEV